MSISDSRGVFVIDQWFRTHEGASIPFGFYVDIIISVDWREYELRFGDFPSDDPSI